MLHAIFRDARRRATRAAIPDKATRQPWSVQREEAFDNGAVASAVRVLTEMMRQYPHPALGEFAGYVRTHAARIPDYAARQAAGQTIGSGAVEKGVDVVVNRRLQGRRGMRWWRERAAGVVALRRAILNDEWEQRVAAAHAA